MGSEAETVFRWKCPNCGAVLEESNQGSLLVAKLAHERSCTPSPTRIDERSKR